MKTNRIEDRVQRLAERRPMLQVAARLLAPSGLPFLLSIPVLNTINKYANEFLQTFNTQVTILPYRELQRMEDRCSIDGHIFGAETICPVCQSERRKAIQEQIEILTERNTTYSQESSGGKALINLAIRLALLTLYKKRNPRAQGLPLILDEVFSHLDETNRTLCLNAVMKLIPQLGITQVFLVTHDTLKYEIPTTLTILREGTRSQVVNGRANNE